MKLLSSFISFILSSLRVILSIFSWLKLFSNKLSSKLSSRSLIEVFGILFLSYFSFCWNKILSTILYLSKLFEYNLENKNDNKLYNEIQRENISAQ